MIRQKQIQHLTYPTLAAFTSSTSNTPEFCFIEGSNAFYRKVAGNPVLIGSSGVTNLALANNTATAVDITNTAGTGVTLLAASVTLAGLMTAVDKVNLAALSTLTGVAAGSVNLATFSGVTIPDNVTIKTALQSLETALELRALDSAVVHIAGAETITGVKTFSAQPVGIIGTSIGNTPAGTISSTTVQAAINEIDVEKQSISEKGQINGYASLDATGKVPAAQLPSYVDDVLEFITVAAFPATGETGKIYTVTTGTDINKIYRWTGSIYVEVSPSAGSPVASVFGRTGTIVAAAGDYTAAQITNVPTGNIAAITVQAAITELDTEKQDKIQLLDEGIGLGIVGQATSWNFTGTGVTATLSGSVATINVTKGFTDNKVQLVPTGINTIPNLTPVPLEPTKVMIFVNSAFVENNGITVSAGGVFTISTINLGHSVDANDIITCHYLSL